MKNHIKIWTFIFIIINSLVTGSVIAGDAQLAPDFRLPDLNNNTVVLSSYKDKQAVILLFWTTWCPFCREELRVLNDMYPELVREGLEVLAVDVGESFSKVERFAQGYYLSYRILLDGNTDVANDYRVMGVPTYFIINRKGHIVFQGYDFPKAKYKELISR